MSIANIFRNRPILIWLLVGASVGGVITVVILALGLFTRSKPEASQDVTPVLMIIPAPSLTPTLSPSPTLEEIQVIPSSTPQLSEPGVIGQGQLVEIFGTGGDGLRLRLQPGLEGKIASLGVESEVFEVQGGPEQVDGYQWWYLVNPYNAEKTGWAVSTYLRSITSP